MNPIIRPIFYLMNQLSYRSKFVLLASLFAIPLVLFSGQLAYTLHQEANQAKLTKTGLNYLQKATSLIADLETLRDISVITSWQSEIQLNEQFETAKLNAIQKITQIKTYSDSEKHLVFLTKLQNAISTNGLIRGNESEGIDGVYEHAHILISQAYSWRTRLSYAFVSRSRNSANIIDTINLLNESEVYLHALGQARTFGSMYLEQKFIDSYGISVLEKTYQTLSQLIDLVDVKADEYKDLISAHPEINSENIKQYFTGARERLYQELIESLSLTGNSLEYYSELTKVFELVYQHNLLLFELSENFLEKDYQESLQRLTIFYTSVGLMILLIAYVYIGLYSTVNLAVRSLMRSARKVAEGKYSEPIRTQTRDELSSVAAAMDTMRLSIQEREEKLAFMGQTDGLTKLFNRQYFDSALEVSLANSLRHHTPFTLVMIDIDHFKSINDTYGHQTGDDCLKQISALLQHQYQRKTDVVARYGGEEFIAILYGSNLEEAEEQTEALRAEIESCPIQSGQNTIYLTASFGLAALVSPNMCTASELIALADTLLYQSKHTGRNRLSSGYFSEDNSKRANE